MTTMEVLDTQQTESEEIERHMAAFLLDPLVVVQAMPLALETPGQKAERMWPSRDTTPHARQVIKIYKDAETAVVNHNATSEQRAYYRAAQEHLEEHHKAYDRPRTELI